MRSPLLALADVHRLTVELPHGACDVFVFDHHRSAFAPWCAAAQRHGPLTLLTLDRHMDLNEPPREPPRFDAPLAELDAYARHGLGPSNDDHIVAALRAGALRDCAVIARSHEPARMPPECIVSPTLERVTPALRARVREAERLVLDVDLDCFTTRSDGHVDEAIPWDAGLIDDFLRPPDWSWAELLPKVKCITLAREPYHCGGLQRGARLWLDFAEVFFRRVLGVPPP